MRKNSILLVIGLILLLTTGCNHTATSHPQTPSEQALLNSSASPSLPAQNTAIEISGKPADNIIGYPENTIQVNSSETVKIIPDMAEVVYAVRSEHTEAAACQTNNNEAVFQVITLLKQLGVAETSIQTSDYYMHPIYSYRNNTTKVVGYEATTTLTVSDLPIDGLGDVLTGSVLTGINTIQSITYQASKYDECYQTALTNAISSAYEKANAMANATGCTIGHVISIQETSGYSEARYTDYARTNQLNAAKEEALVDTAVQMMPGEISVEASIIVEYQLLYPNP